MYNVHEMKTLAKFFAAVLFVAGFVLFVRKTCNIVVVKEATYDGIVGRWERTPSGEYVFSDDMGPYVVFDSIPGTGK